MNPPDLNLLVPLDAVLSEGSVAAAARRLGLSPSAMSRALARLREVTGDPLLVRAGRGLVPTPRALALREEIGPLLEAACAALRPAAALDLARLARCFTLRTRDGFVENFGPALIARIAREAPGVRLRFLPRPDTDTTALQDGSADLDTGVVRASTDPALHAQALFEDHFIGVMRANHALARGTPGLEDYLRAQHVAVSRRGLTQGPIDTALATLGVERRIQTTVGDFATALALVRDTDLVATLPARHTVRLREGLHSVALPFAAPTITVSMLWHARMHAEPAHRWLRGCLREVCANTPGT